jgi:Acetyltransferase (GNAT) domain
MLFGNSPPTPTNKAMHPCLSGRRQLVTLLLSIVLASMSDSQVIMVDGITYTMRGLKDEEIDQWANFCASVFAYKANPPSASYFARHYSNDPHRVADWVRVIFHGKEIVASCRIFARQISIGNGKSVEAGGIGEVCTGQAHRKRGLSKRLLQDCIRIMTLRSMQVSMLHASPIFFPVYARVQVFWFCLLSSHAGIGDFCTGQAHRRQEINS